MVLSYMRNTSSLEFVNTAQKIEYEVTDIIYRNFGAKKKVQKFEVANRKGEFTEDEIKAINDILEKHDTDIENLELIRKIPDFLVIEKYKQFEILANKIVNYTYEIESLYPNTVFKYLKRNLNIQLCIGTLKNLNNRLIDFCLLTHAKVNKLENLLTMIHNEIKLLNGVKEHDKEEFKEIHKLVTKMKFANLDDISDKFMEETNNVILESFYDNIKLTK